MKKLPGPQIQNIIFTAIVAIAAVALYLLVGSDIFSKEAVPSPTPTSTPTSTPTQTPEPRFAPVPKDVFTMRIAGSEAFHAGIRREETNAFNLVCGDEYTGAAALTYSVNDMGCVTAFALRFPYPEAPSEKPATNEEIAYARLYPTYIARQNKAIETMLREILSIADVNDVFSEPIKLRWYTGAVAARDYKKYYTDTYEHCEFMAYPSQWGTEQVVICSFMEQ